MKIAMIGAGSRDFGRGVVADVMLSPLAREGGLHLALCDADQSRLSAMCELANRIRDFRSVDVSVTCSTDVEESAEGADYVILSVAKMRYPLWEQDFRLPNAYGFKQVLGENAGPGAVFHALRSLELVIPIAEKIKNVSPDATVLNFTNPESVVVRGIMQLVGLKTIGLCHGAFAAREKISQLLAMNEEDLHIISGGLNHLYWVTEIRDKSTGEDLYPEFKKKALKVSSALPPLCKELLDLYGLLTYPSDDHCGEFFAFGHEHSGLKWPYGQESRKAGTPGPADIEPDGSTASLNAKVSMEEIARPSGEIALDAISAIERAGEFEAPAIILINTGSFVEGLPEDAAVEVPAIVDKDGFHPKSIGRLPPAPLAMCFLHAQIQGLLVDAYRYRSRKTVLAALSLCPQVNSLGSAKALLDEMFELQAEFLPVFGS